MSELDRLEQARRRLPVLAAAATEIVVDNPAMFAGVVAGTIVLTRAAVRIVRPRSLLEVLALVVVLELTIPQLARVAIERGLLPPVKVRDADGRLVRLADLEGGPGATAA